LYEGSISFRKQKWTCFTLAQRLGAFHPSLRDIWSKVKLWRNVDCTRIDESTCALRRNRSTYVRVATAAAKWLHFGLTTVSAQSTVEWNSFRVSVVLLFAWLTLVSKSLWISTTLTLSRIQRIHSRNHFETASLRYFPLFKCKWITI